MLERVAQSSGGTLKWTGQRRRSQPDLVQNTSSPSGKHAAASTLAGRIRQGREHAFHQMGCKVTERGLRPRGLVRLHQMSRSPQAVSTPMVAVASG